MEIVLFINRKINLSGKALLRFSCEKLWRISSNQHTDHEKNLLLSHYHLAGGAAKSRWPPTSPARSPLKTALTRSMSASSLSACEAERVVRGPLAFPLRLSKARMVTETPTANHLMPPRDRFHPAAKASALPFHPQSPASGP